MKPLLRDRLAFEAIGTPLQRPLEALRRTVKQWRKPGIPEIALEPERMRKFLQGTIRDGMNCVDVGSHLGWTLHEIVRLSPRGEHIAIEPVGYKADWLRRRYPQVQVHQLVLGDQAGSVDFWYDPVRSGYSSTCVAVADTGLERIDTPVRKLDDLLSEGHRIDLIKMDVVGGELAVLRGAQRILARDRPAVLAACTLLCLKTHGLTAESFFEFVTESMGYRIFLLKDWLAGGEVLDFPRFDQAMRYPFQAFNFVLMPRSR
jgi:FkbM family methyltransferase